MPLEWPNLGDTIEFGNEIRYSVNALHSSLDRLRIVGATEIVDHAAVRRLLVIGDESTITFVDGKLVAPEFGVYIAGDAAIPSRPS
jgi:hypothetical protein